MQNSRKKHFCFGYISAKSKKAYMNTLQKSHKYTINIPFINPQEDSSNPNSSTKITRPLQL